MIVAFKMLNYAEESINTYDTGDKSEWESDFSTDISDYDSSDSDLEAVVRRCSSNRCS